MYPEINAPERWLYPEALRHHARERPDKTFVGIVEGDTLSYAQAYDDMGRVAEFLRRAGVAPGDRVAVLLHNGIDIIRTWLGLGRLGAVFVVLNTELKGSFLAHQLRSSGARIAITSPALLDRILGLAGDVPSLDTILLTGNGEPPCAEGDGLPWRFARFDGWRDCDRYDGPMPRASDVAAIMYTSGTSGPAKGVLMPHAHCVLFGIGSVDHLRMTERDVYYVVLPLFHANGLFMQVGGCLIAGATAMVRQRFSATAWLRDIRATEATLTNTLGVLSAFVFEQPPGPNDRDHRLRLILAAPNVPEHEAIWKSRFGVGAVVSAFGMTEINIVAWGTEETSRPGTAGRLYDRHFEVEIHDPETDTRLDPDRIGEIVVRPRTPFAFMAGYDGMPEKTVEAWRNLWFRTGDAGVIEQDGHLIFVDRIRDCIRRRGENISSFEIESSVICMPGVVEVAAFAVPASIEGGEDEVMLAVVLEQSSTCTAEDIVSHVDRELPRFALPRFVEIVSELPKTPTGKVQKAELRRRGVTTGTWDRERLVNHEPAASS